MNGRYTLACAIYFQRVCVVCWIASVDLLDWPCEIVARIVRISY